MTAKTCTKCGETKPLDDYRRDKTKSDGHGPACRSCVREWNRAYYRANREQIADQKRAHYRANREKLAERRRAYRAANREQIDEKNRAYRAANREQEAERSRAHYALVGAPGRDRKRRIAARYATRSGRWSEAEDQYLIRTDDSLFRIALDLGRTYGSVVYRSALLRRRGVTLARDLPTTSTERNAA